MDVVSYRRKRFIVWYRENLYSIEEPWKGVYEGRLAGTGEAQYDLEDASSGGSDEIQEVIHPLGCTFDGFNEFARVEFNFASTALKFLPTVWQV